MDILTLCSKIFKLLRSNWPMYTIINTIIVLLTIVTRSTQGKKLNHIVYIYAREEFETLNKFMNDIIHYDICFK